MYTVFELDIVEVLVELFKKPRGESQLPLLQLNESSEQCVKTRRVSKRLFPPTYNRTVALRKTLSNSLKKEYSWFIEMTSLPSILRELSQFQVKKLISESSTIYVVENREFFSIFYTLVYYVTLRGSFRFPSKVLSIVF